MTLALKEKLLLLRIKMSFDDFFGNKNCYNQRKRRLKVRTIIKSPKITKTKLNWHEGKYNVEKK